MTWSGSIAVNKMSLICGPDVMVMRRKTAGGYFEASPATTG